VSVPLADRPLRLLFDENPAGRLVGAAQLARLPLALAQLLQFRLPAHVR
jgi:hypothetical protein